MAGDLRRQGSRSSGSRNREIRPRSADHGIATADLVDPGAAIGDWEVVGESPSQTWVCSYLSLTLLLGVGAYAVVGWWWADPMGALAMLPVILWQGWLTLAEAREPAGHED